MRTRTSVLIFILALAFNGAANAYEIDWPKVDAALGKTASVRARIIESSRLDGTPALREH